MAKAVFTGEEVKGLSLVDASTRLASGYAEVSKFPDHFLMRDGPGHRRYRLQ
jgi:hypothetical protein